MHAVFSCELQGVIIRYGTNIEEQSCFSGYVSSLLPHLVMIAPRPKYTLRLTDRHCSLQPLRLRVERHRRVVRAPCRQEPRERK